MMCWRWQWRRELFHPRWRGPEPSGVEGRRESEMVVNALFYCSIEGIQRYPSLCAPSLVKFVPAIARLFCLALPGSLTTGSSKKNPAKFSDTCSVRADGLCIDCLGQWAERVRENSNMQEFFCTTLYVLRRIKETSAHTYFHQNWSRGR